LTLNEEVCAQAPAAKVALKALYTAKHTQIYKIIRGLL